MFDNRSLDLKKNLLSFILLLINNIKIYNLLEKIKDRREHRREKKYKKKWVYRYIEIE
jgi:hypothetical protein